jgi:type IV secretion system protein VirB9
VLPNILNIKPTVFDSKSNLSVVTVNSDGTHRYYRFALSSNSKPVTTSTGQTYAIEFSYPEDEKAKLISSLQNTQKNLNDFDGVDAWRNKERYEWDYSYHGSPTVKPLHVFDDGTFTYLELRQGEEVPAVFAVTNPHGDESVVNSRREGNYLVIEQIAPQFTLRSGYAVGSIFNNALLTQGP